MRKRGNETGRVLWNETLIVISGSIEFQPCTFRLAI